ncbi:MAG: stage III sporulation protein AG [Eubacteriales bacterium]
MKDWFSQEDKEKHTEEEQELINKKIDLKRYLTRDNMIIVVLIGVLLFIIAIPTGDGTESTSMMVKEDLEVEKEEIKEIMNEAIEAEDEEEFYEVLERRLEEVLSFMEGVGEVKVMITIAASEEIVIEKDSPSVRNNTTENDSDGGSRTISEVEMDETTIYETKEDGTLAPVIVKIIEPEIEGVVVIAEGGGDVHVQNNITETIQSLFDINVNKIKVVKMK